MTEVKKSILANFIKTHQGTPLGVLDISVMDEVPGSESKLAGPTAASMGRIVANGHRQVMRVLSERGQRTLTARIYGPLPEAIEAYDEDTYVRTMEAGKVDIEPTQPLQQAGKTQVLTKPETGKVARVTLEVISKHNLNELGLSSLFKKEEHHQPTESNAVADVTPSIESDLDLAA